MRHAIDMDDNDDRTVNPFKPDDAPIRSRHDWESSGLGIIVRTSESQKCKRGIIVGLTILVRLIQQIGHDNLKDRLEWYSPTQAREVFLYPWSLAKWNEWKDKKVRYEEQRKLPWPDGRVIVDGKAYWVEFDNDTKNEALIKEQFRRYIEGLAYLPDYVEVHDPVIWVTPHADRKNEMRDWWSVVKEEPDFTGLELIPKMFFFTEGEEIDFMLEKRMVQLGKMDGTVLNCCIGNCIL